MIKSEKMSDILKSFRFEEVNEAIKYYHDNITRGKVLLKPNIFDDDHDDHNDDDGIDKDMNLVEMSHQEPTQI